MTAQNDPRPASPVGGEALTPDAGREAIWKVVHEVWQLLDDAETNGATGHTAVDQDRLQAVSDAMDALEALVPDSEGPFWGGFPVNYLWPKGVGTMSVCSTCAGYGYARGGQCWTCKGSGSEPVAALSAPSVTGEGWMSLSPDDQIKLATRIAANVGYELTPEPPHPDCPHNREDAALSPTAVEERCARMEALLTTLWQSVYDDTQRSPAATISLATIQAAEAARQAIEATS
jgi:hypothetical protein